MRVGQRVLGTAEQRAAARHARHRNPWPRRWTNDQGVIKWSAKHKLRKPRRPKLYDRRVSYWI